MCFFVIYTLWGIKFLFLTNHSGRRLGKPVTRLKRVMLTQK
jgi:hypothetical protein